MDQLLEILNELKPDVDFSTETGLIDNAILDSFDIVQLISTLKDTFEVMICSDQYTEIKNETVYLLSLSIKLIRNCWSLCPFCILPESIRKSLSVLGLWAVILFFEDVLSCAFLEKEHFYSFWTQGVGTLLKMCQNKHLIFMENALSSPLLIPWALSEKPQKLR